LTPTAFLSFGKILTLLREAVCAAHYTKAPLLGGALFALPSDRLLASPVIICFSIILFAVKLFDGVILTKIIIYSSSIGGLIIDFFISA
jgi:hypothetical protein